MIPQWVSEGTSEEDGAQQEDGGPHYGRFHLMLHLNQNCHLLKIKSELGQNMLDRLDTGSDPTKSYKVLNLTSDMSSLECQPGSTGPGGVCITTECELGGMR